MRFSEAICDEKLASPQSNYLYAYGLYLANGGTPEGFQEMNDEDVAIMFNSYMALQENNNRKILNGIIRIVNAMFGGREE